MRGDVGRTCDGLVFLIKPVVMMYLKYLTTRLSWILWLHIHHSVTITGLIVGSNITGVPRSIINIFIFDVKYCFYYNVLPSRLLFWLYIMLVCNVPRVVFGICEFRDFPTTRYQRESKFADRLVIPSCSTEFPSLHTVIFVSIIHNLYELDRWCRSTRLLIIKYA